MAEKKASQIAKEHGMSAMDLLMQLRDAGITVTAASALVDEDRVVEALGLSAGGGASAAFDFGQSASAVAAPPASEAPGNGNGAPAAPANGEATAPAAPAAPASAPPAGRPSAGPRVIGADEFVPRPAAPIPLTPMPKPAPAPKAATPAPAASAPAPVEASEPEKESVPEAVETVEDADAVADTTAEAAAAEAPDAEASTPADAAVAETVPEATTEAQADVAAKPAAKGKKGAKVEEKEEEPKIVPSKEKPPPGAGPRILAVPEPPKRPKRDESANLPRTAAGGPGGRRRVVIDSQAARRGPGGPGGPGGGPNQPPRRQRRGRRRRGVYNDAIAPLDVEAQSSIDTVKISSGSNVKEVAEAMGVPVPDVIKKLMMLGQMATLAQTLPDDAIQLIAEEFDKTIEIVAVGEEDDTPTYEDDPADLVSRPPVVTIMGHVDHGKTSLLDAIREADVVGGEAGGITQHIGAYQVHHGDKTVTFLDTPGHEAFTAMRARGAKATDIAIIVVAADDGVKPQTREAVDHALAAEVPVLVAVNKIDKEGADPTRVRTEMTTLGLQPAEWGGDIEFVDVSAKARTGLEDLLETINVVAELEDLKANPAADASGIVIESKLDPGRGPVVTMLVQRGTLKIGDAVVAGPEWGKVRALTDYHGTRTKTAVPGDPIEILGFDGVPRAGESIRVVANDRVARREANERETRLKSEALARRSGRKISLEDVFKRQSAGGVKELAVILKADVAGSVEALEDEIAKLPQDEVFVDVISSGVGGITESDVMLASASEAIIMGFNVRPVGDARGAAEREGIEIRHYSVIYKALDELRDAMTGMLDPEEVEDTVGQVEVRAIFRASKIGIIAGSYVTEGKVTRGGKVRIIRDGTVIASSTVAGLKRFNDDAREVATGFECGITLANNQDIREGDVFEVYETRKVNRELA